jgi:hypothetical protein
MAIALVGTPTTTSQAGGNRTITVNYSTGHASGHVAVAFITAASANTITGSKTWSTVQTTASLSGFEGYLLTRVLDGTEGSSETFTMGTNVSVYQVEMRVYSGVNNATSLDTAASNPQPATGTSSSAAVAGFTTIQNADELVFFVASVATNSTYTTPSTPGTFGNAVTNLDSTNGQSIGGWDYSQTSAGATGATATTTSGSSVQWFAMLVALQPAATAVSNFPQQIRRLWQKHRAPQVKAKRVLRATLARLLPQPDRPTFPAVHSHQKRRIPIVKAKPRVRNRWLTERQVTAPHADFPQQLRRQNQKHRISLIKAKRSARSSIELRIPEPTPMSAVMRHPRGQKKRTPQIKAKRVIRSSIEFRIPQAPNPNFPQSIRHNAQKRRIPQVRAKHQRNRELFVIPNTASPTLPIGKPRQRDRKPYFRPRRTAQSSIVLRIPQSPHADLPLTGRHDLQKKRIPQVKAKRVVQDNLQLRIPPAPHMDMPTTMRHTRSQPKRGPKVRAKRIVRNSIELYIPQAPHADLPLALRRCRTQPIRLYRLKAKPSVQGQLILIQSASFALPRARAQRKRLVLARQKKTVRTAFGLRPQLVKTPTPIVRGRTLRKRLFAQRPRHAVRNSIINTITRLAAITTPIAPISMRKHFKRKHLVHVRAKRIGFSKFLQLSKLLVPPSPTGTDAIIVWRSRGGF